MTVCFIVFPMPQKHKQSRAKLDTEEYEPFVRSQKHEAHRFYSRRERTTIEKVSTADCAEERRRAYIWA